MHAPSNGTHPAAKDSLKQHQRKPNGTEIGHDEAFSASSCEWADGRSVSKRVPRSVEQGMSMEHGAGVSSDQIKSQPMV